MDRAKIATLPLYMGVAMVVLVCAIHYLLATMSNILAHEFEGYDEEIPWLWNFLLHNSPYYWFIPLISARFLVLHQHGYLRRRRTVFAGVLGTIVSMAICFFGLYLPAYYLALEGSCIR